MHQGRSGPNTSGIHASSVKRIFSGRTSPGFLCGAIGLQTNTCHTIRKQSVRHPFQSRRGWCFSVCDKFMSCASYIWLPQARASTGSLLQAGSRCRTPPGAGTRCQSAPSRRRRLQRRQVAEPTPTDEDTENCRERGGRGKNDGDTRMSG